MVKIRIEPNDIQYMGMSGISVPCLDAVEKIVTDEHPPSGVTLGSTLQRPTPTSRGIPGEHLFLAWGWGGVPLTVVHSGFATGYPGEGPRTFSLALCMILNENIKVASVKCDARVFDMIDEKRVTERVIEPFRCKDMLDNSEPRNEWIANGWIHPAHLEALESGSFWSYYRAPPEVKDLGNEGTPPTAFISYSWDEESHMSWVKELATRLRKDGIETRLDQWYVFPGDSITEFIETGIRESDFVVIICTPRYKERSDNRMGGVGYEESVITGEVFVNQSNRKKSIPVLRIGAWADAAPSRLTGVDYVNLSGPAYSEREYARLRDVLLGQRETAPPIGGGLRARDILRG